jgi:CheY-like chemotaxis protein
MDGNIAVESVPGVGSVFTISVPFANAPAGAVVASPVPAAPALAMPPAAAVASSAAAPASAIVAINPTGSPVPPPAKSVTPVPPALRVLVVEDNATNQMVLLAMLKRLGQTVEVVGDGAKAVEAVRAKDYDLVLMDVQMPDMDGYEATRRIRALDEARASSLPIVALTANVVPGHEALSLEAGMNDHVAKPLTLARLTDLLNRWGQTKRGKALVA